MFKRGAGNGEKKLTLSALSLKTGDSAPASPKGFFTVRPVNPADMHHPPTSPTPPPSSSSSSIHEPYHQQQPQNMQQHQQQQKQQQQQQQRQQNISYTNPQLKLQFQQQPQYMQQHPSQPMFKRKSSLAQQQIQQQLHHSTTAAASAHNQPASSSSDPSSPTSPTPRRSLESMRPSTKPALSQADLHVINHQQQILMARRSFDERLISKDHLMVPAPPVPTLPESYQHQQQPQQQPVAPVRSVSKTTKIIVVSDANVTPFFGGARESLVQVPVSGDVSNISVYTAPEEPTLKPTEYTQPPPSPTPPSSSPQQQSLQPPRRSTSFGSRSTATATRSRSTASTTSTTSSATAAAPSRSNSGSHKNNETVPPVPEDWAAVITKAGGGRAHRSDSTSTWVSNADSAVTAVSPMLGVLGVPAGDKSSKLSGVEKNASAVVAQQEPIVVNAVNFPMPTPTTAVKTGAVTVGAGGSVTVDSRSLYTIAKVGKVTETTATAATATSKTAIPKPASTASATLILPGGTTEISMFPHGLIPTEDHSDQSSTTTISRRSTRSASSSTHHPLPSAHHMTHPAQSDTGSTISNWVSNVAKELPTTTTATTTTPSTADESITDLMQSFGKMITSRNLSTRSNISTFSSISERLARPGNLTLDIDASAATPTHPYRRETLLSDLHRHSTLLSDAPSRHSTTTHPLHPLHRLHRTPTTFSTISEAPSTTTISSLLLSPEERHEELVAFLLSEEAASMGITAEEVSAMLEAVEMVGGLEPLRVDVDEQVAEEVPAFPPPSYEMVGFLEDVVESFERSLEGVEVEREEAEEVGAAVKEEEEEVKAGVEMMEAVETPQQQKQETKEAVLPSQQQAPTQASSSSIPTPPLTPSHAIAASSSFLAAPKPTIPPSFSPVPDSDSEEEEEEEEEESEEIKRARRIAKGKGRAERIPTVKKEEKIEEKKEDEAWMKAPEKELPPGYAEEPPAYLEMRDMDKSAVKDMDKSAVRDEEKSEMNRPASIVSPFGTPVAAFTMSKPAPAPAPTSQAPAPSQAKAPEAPAPAPTPAPSKSATSAPVLKKSPENQPTSILKPQLTLLERRALRLQSEPTPFSPNASVLPIDSRVSLRRSTGKPSRKAIPDLKHPAPVSPLPPTPDQEDGQGSPRPVHAQIQQQNMNRKRHSRVNAVQQQGSQIGMSRSRSAGPSLSHHQTWNDPPVSLFNAAPPQVANAQMLTRSASGTHQQQQQQQQQLQNPMLTRSGSGTMMMPPSTPMKRIMTGQSPPSPINVLPMPRNHQTPPPASAPVPVGISMGPKSIHTTTQHQQQRPLSPPTTPGIFMGPNPSFASHSHLSLQRPHPSVPMSPVSPEPFSAPADALYGDLGDARPIGMVRAQSSGGGQRVVMRNVVQHVKVVVPSAVDLRGVGIVREDR
ncbi:hypothetical protein HDU97_001393 [Phlyctochytrium planicorne]|nr:hypothetical protein HDU97_001393 [Phlyctochytrium planicorne]